MAKHTITVDELKSIALSPVNIQVAVSSGSGSQKEFILVCFPGSEHMYFVVTDRGDKRVFDREDFDVAVEFYNEAP